MNSLPSLRILRAEHMGMCFGVRDALSLAHRQANAQPLTVLGDLVHNETVLADLRRRGIQLEQNLDAVTTQTVLITAHGASEKRLAAVTARGHRLIEATCPLVHVAHRAVRTLVSEGYHPVIVGRHDHVEVRGITEDLEAFHVVLTEADVDALPHHDRFGVAAQTTQPIDRVQTLVQRLRARFPNSQVRFIDTVCLPTKQRQAAAEELARIADVVVVVGGAHSNNTRELANTCRAYGAQVRQIVTAAELCEDWFQPGETVGITAGTSTPAATIAGVEEWLHALSDQMDAAATAKGQRSPELAAMPL